MNEYYLGVLLYSYGMDAILKPCPYNSTFSINVVIG